MNAFVNSTCGRRLAQFALCLAVAMALFLAGCGGGGGGGGETPVDSTPVISNLQFAPTTILQNEGNGTLIVSGTFDYTDAGKDLATLHLTGADGSTLSSPIEGVAGTESGTIQGMVEVDTSIVGLFSFQLFVTDSGGRKSNILSGTFEVKPNDTGTRWTQQALPVPPGTSLWQKRVRWSGSLFVTVGASIFTSPDAVTWTERASGLTAMLNDLTWTGSQFVAVGANGQVLTSPTGTAWTQQPIPVAGSAALNGVAASSTRLVAVGTQSDPVSGAPVALIMSSPDGVTWTAAPGTIPAALNAVVWSGSQFVAVGSTLGLPNAEAIALTSPDGITWTSRPINATGLNVLHDIAWNGSRFVAVGYAGAVTSTDGATWQATGVGVVGPNNAIGWSGQRFMSCGVVYCQVSTDGLQWQTAAPLPGTGPAVYGLAWNGSKWVVVGVNSYVATSP